MKNGITVIFLLFILISANGQSNYLLDSIHSVFFFAPNFSQITAEKYHYNEDEQLILKTHDQGYSEFTYSKRTIEEQLYVKFDELSEPFKSTKQITHLNRDGFEIKREVIIPDIDGNRKISLDSTIRDNKNRTVEFYQFVNDWNTNTLQLNNRRVFEYEDDRTIHFLYEFYNIETQDVNFSIEVDYIYDDQGKISQEIRTEYFSFSGTVSAIKSYEYEGNMLKSIRSDGEDNYGNDIIQIEKYTHNYPYRTVEYYNVWGPDESEVMFQRIWSKQSVSPYFAYDTTRTFLAPLSDNKLTNESHNSETKTENGKKIRVRQFQRSFNFETNAVQSFSNRQSFYILKELDNSIELDDLLVFPNPATAGSTILINTPTLEYDRLVIINEMGQKVYEQSVDYSPQIMLVNPINTTGIYFVRVEKEGKPLSTWSKLIVH